MNNKLWLMAVGIGLALVLSVGGIVLAQDSGSTNTQTPGAVSVNVQNQQTGIVVNGEGKVTVTPDLAIITLGVESQGTTVSEAQSKAAEAMNKVIASLKNNGVADKDIQTQYYNISQMTRWDDKSQTENITGYRVSNTVTVKIRDLTKAGTIIDAVATAGGDLTRINGISFSVEDSTTAAQQAREKAMADAKAKAQQLATLGGVTLGKPTYISESTSTPYYGKTVMVPAVAGGYDSSSTIISSGELDITVNVQITYAIMN
jgi:uncharacterized protein